MTYEGCTRFGKPGAVGLGGPTIVTSNLPFEDNAQLLDSERLTGALLDRLTHHVSILTMNGDSYRLKQSAGRRRSDAIKHSIIRCSAIQNQGVECSPKWRV